MAKQSDRILMAYLRVTQHMSKHFRSHFSQLYLTFPQALVLNVLAAGGPMPISSLAEQTGSANSTVSGVVDRLEKLGLAKRERSSHDRRVIYVSVTEQYQILRRQTATNVNGYFTSLLETMSKEERETILLGLEKLEEALVKSEASKG